MTSKKIIIGVILATLFLVIVIFFIQESDKQKSLENNLQKKEDNGGVIYKLAKDNNCKLGVDSIDGEKKGINFYRVCPGKSVVAIDQGNCAFPACPIIKKEQDISDWAMYKNDKYKFSLKYPKDWKVLVTEPEDGTKKIEVLFSNKECSTDLFVPCPIGYTGYLIALYEKSPEQLTINIKNVDYYKKTSNEIEEMKLFSGENIPLYITSEFNENNFKETVDSVLPGAQAILDKEDYSVYLMGDFRGNVETLEYFKASIKTLGFD